MSDKEKTKKQLINELEVTLQHINDLEEPETESRKVSEYIEKEVSAITSVINNILLGEIDDIQTHKNILHTCLKATDSTYGMIGKINEDGRFDMSTYNEQTLYDYFPEPLFYELSKDMTIRGIWGWPMLHAKSLICNDLKSHPDRIGFPEGHAPITCFLGVPLMQGSKVVGMVAVANKPGGYTETDKAILTRLASVIGVSHQHRLAVLASRQTQQELEILAKERSNGLGKEIFDRVQIQETLSNADLRYLTISDFTIDWEWWYSPEGYFIYTSPSCKRITGYEASEFLADAGLFRRIIHRDDLPIWDDHRHGSSQDEEGSSIEFRIIHKDGSERWIEHVCQPVFVDKDRFLGTRGSNRDISKHKHVKEQVDRQNALLLAINEVFRETINCKTENELGKKCLAIAEKLTNSKFGFICEKTNEDYLITIAISGPGWDVDKTSGEKVEKLTDAMPLSDILAKIIGDVKSYILNDLTSHPDLLGVPEGHPVMTSFLGVPLKADTGIVGMIGLGNKEGGYTSADQENVESLAEAILKAWLYKRAKDSLEVAEENFRNSLDNSPLGVRVITEDGKLLYANKAILDIYGYSKIEELRDIPTKQRYTPESYAEHQERKEKRKRGEFVPSDYEISIIRRDGEVRYLSVLRREIIWNGKTKFQLLYRDITERKQLEKEQERAVRLDSIGLFAGGIAHDFNNYLTSILANVSFARKSAESGDIIGSLLSEAEEAVNEAKDLTHQLLTFAKGGSPIKKTILINKLIEDITKFALRGSNIKSELFMPDDLWRVEVDESQIRQVMSNLILNAAEAMAQGGTIQIKTENYIIGNRKDHIPLPKGRYIKLELIDHGIGIPKENLHRVFDPYFSTKKQGSGLGLATAYSIIKAHGGYIDVESRLGSGTTFRIFLPVSKKPVTKARKQKKVLQLNLLNKSSILVMDDNKAIRKMLKIALGMAYQVATASDGAEVLKLYAEAQEKGQPFDIVIMDLTIPGGIGGEEAIRDLLNIDPDATVIVSSGYSNNPIMSQYKKYGFKGVLRKPYDIDELRATIENVLSSKQAVKPIS